LDWSSSSFSTLTPSPKTFHSYWKPLVDVLYTKSFLV
jgi:hypothetical protein